jgi:hypothetical protein
MMQQQQQTGIKTKDQQQQQQRQLGHFQHQLHSGPQAHQLWGWGQPPLLHVLLCSGCPP